MQFFYSLKDGARVEAAPPDVPPPDEVVDPPPLDVVEPPPDDVVCPPPLEVVCPPPPTIAFSYARNASNWMFNSILLIRTTESEIYSFSVAGCVASALSVKL